MAEELWEPPPLRRELERITRDLVGDRFDEQIAAIAALRVQFPHSITLVEPADRTRQFTCYQYAFELRDIPPRIAHISWVHEDVFPNRRFVQYLANNHLTHVPFDDRQDGDVLVWSIGGTIYHAGKALAAGAISKWGTGHMWRHGLLEVPWGYGIDIDAFRPITRDEALAAFVAFARDELGDDLVDDLVGPEERPPPNSRE